MKRLNLLNQKWFQNYKVKLFSFLCAVFLWFYVITDNVFEHSVKVPLRLKNQPAGWILAESIPEKVKVLFSGSGKNLLSLGYRDKIIEIDLNQETEPAVIHLGLGMLKGIPGDLQITPLRIIDPDSIRIRLDLFAVQKVPVQSNFLVNPMDGYTQVGLIRLEPDSIYVSGPKSLVQNISFVSTKAIEIQGIMKELNGKIPLEIPAEETLLYSESNLEYAIDIQRIGEKTISDIPVHISLVPRNMKVSVVPSSLSLKLQGGVKVLSKVTKDNISASIDFRNRNRYPQNRIPATIQVPPEISFSDVKPRFFELVIER